jgi:hypothetical protein
MVIEKTVEIPANRRVYFDLPYTVPCGMADFEISVLPHIKVSYDEAHSGDYQKHETEFAKPLRGFFKGSKFTVAGFMEERRSENER